MGPMSMDGDSGDSVTANPYQAQGYIPTPDGAEQAGESGGGMEDASSCTAMDMGVGMADVMSHMNGTPDPSTAPADIGLLESGD